MPGPGVTLGLAWKSMENFNGRAAMLLSAEHPSKNSSFAGQLLLCLFVTVLAHRLWKGRIQYMNCGNSPMIHFAEKV